MDKQKLENCIQIIRKLPTSKLEQNINALTNLIYDEDDTLNAFLQKVDNPLHVCSDDIMGDFIKCEYNRDGDSHRSPLSNKYYPPADDLRYPVQDLRELEIKLNKMFAHYAKAYYSPTAVCSCYTWELGQKIEEGIAVAVLIKNNVSLEKEVESGTWDSSNFLTVNFNKTVEGILADYSLITTVFLQMSFMHKVCGKVNLSGSITKKAADRKILKTHLDEYSHVEAIGQLVEEMENNLRNVIEEVYFKKTKEIIDTARFNPVEGKPNIEQATKIKEMFHAEK